MNLQRYIVADNVRTQLVDPISAGDTSLEVLAGDGSLFGTPSATTPVIITIEDLVDNSDPTSNVVTSEKVLCEGRATDVLQNLTRGYDGSSSASFPADAWVSIYSVSKHLEGLYDFLEDPTFDALDLEDVASSVNKVQIVSSITTEPVEVKATGSDTNIDMLLSGKGTGAVTKNSYKWVANISNSGMNITVGDGKTSLKVPTELTGMNLVSVRGFVETAGTTGTLDIQIARIRAGAVVDMLSTKLTIDSTENSSDTAVTPAVIDTTKDDLITDDVVRIDVDTVQSTIPKGGYVELIFRLP